MARKIGFNGYLGFGRETTFGTAVQPADFLEYTSESLQLNEEELLIDSINGNRQFTKRVRGSKSVDGSINYHMSPGVVLKWLENSAGQAGTVSTLAAGEYQWTFIFRDPNTNPSLTFAVCTDESDTLSSYQFTGCKIASQNFSVSPGGLLEGSAAIMGRDMASANTVAAASYQAQAPYVFKQGVLKVGNSSTVATSTSIESWSMNIDNGLVSSMELGSNTVAAIERGRQNITMEIAGPWNDNDLVNRFVNNTRSYFEVTFDSGVTISTTNTHKLVFKAFNCYFNGQKPNTGGPSELINGTFPIRCIDDVASTGALMAIVTTSQATV